MQRGIRVMTYRRTIYKQSKMSEANFDLGFDIESDENSRESSEKNEGEKKTSRFSSKTSKEKDKIMEDRHRENTQRATKNSVKILTDYLAEKKLKSLEELENKDLPDILLHFYCNLKKAKGGDYKLQALKCIPAGINRHTKETRNLDIINDLSFTKTNEMFKAVSTQARKEGRGSTKNTPPIEIDDLIKCNEYFNHDVMNDPNPRKIQQCVLFNIIYYFCRRGRQNIYDFTQDMFQISTDSEGKRYVYQAIDEMDKNHDIYVDKPANEGRMYEVPGAPLCLVNVFELYVSKLNKDFNYFWQRPKKAQYLHFTSKIWYDKVRVGHGPLENFMSTLSREAQLSKQYTNHSISSNVIGILEEKFAGRHVIGLSGHKNESTIKQYATQLPEKKKREMSTYLADTITPNKCAKPDQPKFQFKSITPSATVSINPNQDENAPPAPPPVQAQNMEFNLEPVNNAAADDALINFLAQFDQVPQNPPIAPDIPQEVQVQIAENAPVPNAVQADPVPQIHQEMAPLQPSNTMNFNSVQNVQNNVNPNQPMIPNMYFGGHSSVTINYNFGTK